MAKVKIKKEQLEAKISSRSPLTQTVVLRVLGVFFPPSLIKFNGHVWFLKRILMVCVTLAE